MYRGAYVCVGVRGCACVCVGVGGWMGGCVYVCAFSTIVS